MLTRKRRQRSAFAPGTGAEACSTRGLRQHPSVSTSTATSYRGSRSSSICGDYPSSTAHTGVDANALDQAIAAAQATVDGPLTPSSFGTPMRPLVTPVVAQPYGRHSVDSAEAPLAGCVGLSPGHWFLAPLEETSSFTPVADPAATASSNHAGSSHRDLMGDAAASPFTMGGVDGAGSDLVGVRTRAAARRASAHPPALSCGSGAVRDKDTAGVHEASSAGVPPSRAPVIDAGPPVTTHGSQPSEGGTPDRACYNCLDSPFLDLHSPFTAWEAFKMVVLLPLVPLRIMLILVSLTCLATCSYLAALGCDLQQPLPWWRRQLVLAGSRFTGGVLLGLGYHVRYCGLDNIQRGVDLRCVVLFNHIAFADAAIMMGLFAPSGVAKAPLATIPLLGTCISAFQNIYVPRETSGSDGADKAALRLANRLNGVPGDQKKSITQMIIDRARDARFPLVAMAPEGTCSDGRSLLQFRKGAFQPGVPVLPVLLQYRWKHFNTAWTNIDERWHTLRMMCQFVNSVDVTVFPPYVPSAAEKADPALYANNVRALYAEASGLPLSGHSQSDFLALTKAGVGVSLNGRRITAAAGVVNAEGCIDLRPYVRSPKIS